MAHSYTPGLKVLKKTLFSKERILPLKGKVLVKQGDKLSPETIVASTSLPGNIQMLKLNNILNIEPGDVKACLVVKKGDSVKKGEIIKIDNDYIAETDMTGWCRIDELINKPGFIQIDNPGDIILYGEPRVAGGGDFLTVYFPESQFTGALGRNVILSIPSNLRQLAYSPFACVRPAAKLLCSVKKKKNKRRWNNRGFIFKGKIIKIK